MSAGQAHRNAFSSQAKINSKREGAVTCRKVRCKHCKGSFHGAISGTEPPALPRRIHRLRKKTRPHMRPGFSISASSVTWRHQSLVRLCSLHGDHQNPRRKPSPNQSLPRPQKRDPFPSLVGTSRRWCYRARCSNEQQESWPGTARSFHRCPA